MKLINKKYLSLFFISLLTIIGCEPTKIDTVENNNKKNFIFVNGGTFTMGDFGHDIEGKHYVYDKMNYNEQYPHKVTLDNFSLNKYKVTWYEYDTFLLDSKRPVLKAQYRSPLDKREPSIFEEPFEWKDERVPYQQTYDDQKDLFNYTVNTPAIVQWQDAKDYCQWLGKKLNLPIDLATEAQWEYAARSGGYEVLFANQMANFNGKPLIIDSDDSLTTDEISIVKKNNIQIINKSKIPYSWKLAMIFSPVGTLSTPNRLGFYDMDYNGQEWVNDWYSGTYFKENPTIKNPQGPITGKSKVVKGLYRYVFDRTPYSTGLFAGFRCAVNQQTPVN